MRFFCTLILMFFSKTSLGYLNPQDFESSQAKNKVLVFLSQKCPCSQSHVNHLNDLTTNNGIQFFGVITDQISKDNKDRVLDYFSPKNFKFPIIKDPEQVLVKKYGALKTPHVTIVKSGKSPQVVYQGGVSNHRFYSQSSKKFLEENVKALSKNQKLVYQRGPSLGCYIRRI